MTVAVSSDVAAEAPDESAAPPPPVAARERLVVLDVLRGIALLGMFVVHFSYYDRQYDGVDTPPWQRVLELFFVDRFYPMFAMLFGIGFAVQLARADARGEPLTTRYLRRLAALAVFGVIAHGVFGFNVLVSYAVWGVALLLIRRWSTRALCALFVACSMHAPLNIMARTAVAEARGDVAAFVDDRMRMFGEFGRAQQAKTAAEQSPSMATVVAARMRFMPHFYKQFLWSAGGSFTLMLAGLLAFRLGVFDAPGRRRRTILLGMIAGAASFASATWLFPLPGAPAMELRALTSSASPTADAAWTLFANNSFNLVRAEWLVLVYIGGVLLLVAHDRAWLDWLAPFAWTGRMALTNYMMQVMLLDVTFSNYGLGFDGRMPSWGIPVGAIGLFFAQTLFARWWLSRYELGPLEWVWRSVTYWRAAPIRRRARATDAYPHGASHPTVP